MRGRNEVDRITQGKQTLGEPFGATHNLRDADELLTAPLFLSLMTTSVRGISAACKEGLKVRQMTLFKTNGAEG